MLKESWTSQFKKDALTRIQEYEKFLNDCGITPVAGAELEFHFTPQASVNYRKLDSIQEFEQSHLVEVLKREETLRNVGEIVLGKGPHSESERHPGERFPSTIARATDSARKIVVQGDKYGMDINYGEIPDVKRVRSLQTNLSLWRSSDKAPLFLRDTVIGESGYVTTPLTLECAKSLLEAQQALTALVSAEDASFKRYSDKNSSFTLSHGKAEKASAALRESPIKTTPFVSTKSPDSQMPRKPVPSSFYFEDRLASSEADPALAMLITLGGIVNGVKSYMQKTGLVDDEGKPDPEKLKAHLTSPSFFQQVPVISEQPDKNFIHLDGHNATPLPKNHVEALGKLKASTVAKDIMGDEFYRAYCAAYEKEAAQKAPAR